MGTTEKRRKFLINAVYFSLFVILYYLFIKYALWIVAPFILAFLIAMLLQKPIRRINEKTHINKKFLSIIFVLLIVAFLAGALTLIGYLAGNELYDFGKTLAGKLGSLPAVIESVKNHMISVVSGLPGKLGATLSDSINGIAEKALSLVREEEAEAAANTASAIPSGSFSLSSLATPLAGILSKAKMIPAVLTAILIGIISCFFMTSDYDGLIKVIKKVASPERAKTLSKTKHVVFDILGKWCKSYATLLFITFCEMAIGLHILKFAGAYKGGYIFAIAVCTAIVDILPVFGTGTILIPWGIISLFMHKVPLGIGLLVIYGVITVIRQVIEPKIVSSNVDVHPVITLMSMYIGIQIFGVLGILILPITVVIVKTLNDEGIIHLWDPQSGEEDETPQLPQAPEEPAAEDSAQPAEAEADVK
ncbi:MAG: sporulation integral membrane protein YtvI [Clostridia bacterium]|nr:sporulation integral membrane protein YtvI [Clostridia bacterium]